MRDGVKLAVKEISAGGVDVGGKKMKIVLVERGDEIKNELGVQIAQELTNKEKVVATVGYINTGVALASQRFYQEAEVPVMNTVATGTKVTQQFPAPNYVFRFSPNDTIQSAMVVEEAIGRQGFKKVAIVCDATNYGQQGPLDEGARGEGHHAGRGREVQHQRYRHDGAASESQGSRSRSDPDLRRRPELAQIANGMAKLGWKVPMIGS